MKDKRISVLFIQYDSNFAGSAQSLADLIESLKTQIHPIVLVSSTGETYDYFINQGIDCYVHPFLMSYHSKRLKQILLHPWQIRPIAFIRKELPCLLLIKKIASSQKVDIIHSNGSVFVIGHRASKLLKIKHVWHIREFYNTPHLGGKPYSIKKIINNADARIIISNACKNDWNLTNINTWMIWDAVRHSNESCYISKKESYILFCASYVTKAKGIVTVIRAFGNSGLTKNGIRLKVVGRCTEEERALFSGLAKEYKCDDSIDFIPFQANVKNLFAKAKAFIQTSTNEGMGRTTVEAMFYGCPVIAFASGGTLDLIDDGKTGYLFNTENECATLMYKVCNTDQTAVILKAQEFVLNNFTIEQYGEKIMEVYHNVLNIR